MVSEADEAAGLTDGREENEAGCCFRPEKPRLPLSAEGRKSYVRHFSSPFSTGEAGRPIGRPASLFSAVGRVLSIKIY